METSVKITFIIVGAILAVALIAGAIYWNVNAPGNNLEVLGQATVKAAPDLVSVYFNVETSGATAQEAKDSNSEIVESVTDNIIKMGLVREDLTTENFNIYEDFVWENGRQRSKGFKASHSLKVQLLADKISKVGEVIDAGVDGGARISYINFELSQEKENEYKALAYKNAAEDARIKAESIAAGLGKSVDKDPVSVSVQEFGYRPWPIYASAGMESDVAGAKAAVTSIEPGEKDVSGQVSVVFRLV